MMAIAISLSAAPRTPVINSITTFSPTFKITSSTVLLPSCSNAQRTGDARQRVTSACGAAWRDGRRGERQPCRRDAWAGRRGVTYHCRLNLSAWLGEYLLDRAHALPLGLLTLEDIKQSLWWKERKAVILASLWLDTAHTHTRYTPAWRFHTVLDNLGAACGRWVTRLPHSLTLFLNTAARLPACHTPHPTTHTQLTCPPLPHTLPTHGHTPPHPTPGGG